MMKILLPLVLLCACTREPAKADEKKTLPAKKVSEKQTVIKQGPIQINDAASYFSKVHPNKGISIRAHKKVSDKAILATAARIQRQLKYLPQVWQQLSRFKAEIHLIAEDHSLTELPRFRYDKASSSHNGLPSGEWKRAISDLHSAISEEGVLLKQSYRFADKRDILCHEFAHAVMDYGIPLHLREEIRKMYLKTKRKGLWPGAYAMSNEMEYFAETTMWYFGTNGDPGKIKPVPRPGPQWLKQYDPDTYDFLDSFWKGKMAMDYSEARDWPKLHWQTYIQGAKSFGKGNTRQRLIFRNESKTAYDIFWLDFKGRKTLKTPLDAGMHFGYSTFSGHLIGLCDKKGKLIKMIRVPKSNGIVTLR